MDGEDEEDTENSEEYEEGTDDPFYTLSPQDWSEFGKHYPGPERENTSWDGSEYATYGNLPPWEPVSPAIPGQIRFRTPLVIEKPGIIRTLTFEGDPFSRNEEGAAQVQDGTSEGVPGRGEAPDERTEGEGPGGDADGADADRS